MIEFIIVLAGVSAGIWLYLLLFRSGFWRERPLPSIGPRLDSWPEVVAVVPARNEAGVVGAAMRSLVNQDYPGRFLTILVDDNSEDATVAKATEAAADGRHRLSVIKGSGLADGWTGKLWAVNQSLAVAAGGYMLVERAAFGRIGEIAAIRHALIDDCALGRALKEEGPIWLGLGEDVASLRGYPAWRDLWNLIARSAFTQLRHSNTLLALTLIGMGLTYLAPPLFALSHDPGIRPFGFIAWALMSLAYVPTLSYHRLSPLWAPFLPCIALFYSAAIVASAWRYWHGGGQWKGRAQALPARNDDRPWGMA